MARSPGISQALARSPGLFVSTVLTCLVGALLPPLPGLMLFVGGLALTVVLCEGGLERPAVRLLSRARVLSEAEAAALAPAIALLCQKGMGPPVVELYARDGEVEISAGATGRHSVVVSSGLLQAAQLGQLPADQAAGVIAAAVDPVAAGACGLPCDRKNGRPLLTYPVRLASPVCGGRGGGGAVRGRWPERCRSGRGRVHCPDVPGAAVATPVGHVFTGRLGPVRGRPRAWGRTRPVPSTLSARAANTRTHPSLDRSRRPSGSCFGDLRPGAFTTEPAPQTLNALDSTEIS
jgi:hypothetical protein